MKKENKKKDISIFPKLLQHFLVRKVNPEDSKSGFKEKERKKKERKRRSPGDISVFLKILFFFLIQDFEKSGENI